MNRWFWEPRVGGQAFVAKRAYYDALGYSEWITIPEVDMDPYGNKF